MGSTDIVQAQPDSPQQEPAVVERHSVTLWGTTDPVEVLDRAQQVARALTGVLERNQLYAEIQGRRHVRVEGWLTLGSMLGVTPVCVWTRPVDRDGARGWEARVEARTLDGRTVAAAESQCLRTERRWARADDYALRSMAQTRATSKALSSALRFVVTLAGFDGTPWEEMQGVVEATPSPPPTAARRDTPRPTGDGAGRQSGAVRVTAARPRDGDGTTPVATVAQRRKIFAQLNRAGLGDRPDRDQVVRALVALATDGREVHLDRLPRDRVDRVLEMLERPDRLIEELERRAAEGDDLAARALRRLAGEPTPTNQSSSPQPELDAVEGVEVTDA